MTCSKLNEELIELKQQITETTDAMIRYNNLIEESAKSGDMEAVNDLFLHLKRSQERHLDLAKKYLNLSTKMIKVTVYSYMNNKARYKDLDNYADTLKDEL